MDGIDHSTNKHDNYWGSHDSYHELSARIEEIAPILENNAPMDDVNPELTASTFAALEPLRISHVFVPEQLGGMQLRPTHGLNIFSALSYHSGSAGWVSFVHACVGAMAAAFLPDSAVSRLFPPGVDNRFSGQGAPLGMLKKVEGGYRLSGKWNYASGFSYATWSHSSAFVDDGSGNPLKDHAGYPVILCAHAPIAEHGRLGNWDVLGLRGTGSIDYDANEIFVPDDLVFPITSAVPQRLKEFFSIGPIGLAAIGHTGWAMGMARRTLDEISKYACSKTGRAGLLGESEKFWFDYGHTEARVRAAAAFAHEIWHEIEQTAERGHEISTRQISIVHLAKFVVHETAEAAVNFAYHAAGGSALRAGTIQRLFREVMVAINHFTASPPVVTSAGRDVGGLWPDRIWRFYDLAPKS